MAAGNTAREKMASAGTNAVTFDMEPGSILQLASMPTNKRVAHGVINSPSEKSEGSYYKTGGELREHGPSLRNQVNSGTVYKGGMCKGERHGRGVEVFSDG